MKRVAFAKYELPYPPSVNGLFANSKRGGRFKTDGYAAWRKAAGEAIQAQGRLRVDGAVSVSIGLVKPDRKRRDVSNLIKAVEDVLVDMQVIADDCHVEDIRARWVASGAPCTVIIQEHIAEQAA